MQLAVSHGYNEIWQMVNAHNSTGTKIQAMPCLGKYGLTVWPGTTASSILNKGMAIQTTYKKYNTNESKTNTQTVSYVNQTHHKHSLLLQLYWYPIRSMKRAPTTIMSSCFLFNAILLAPLHGTNVTYAGSWSRNYMV